MKRKINPESFQNYATDNNKLVTQKKHKIKICQKS